MLEISGIRTIITDTAGLRKTTRKVEKIGIDRTKKSIEENNKFILVLSPDCYTNQNCKLVNEVLKNLDLKKTILVFNKKIY